MEVEQLKSSLIDAEKIIDDLKKSMSYEMDIAEKISKGIEAKQDSKIKSLEIRVAELTAMITSDLKTLKESKSTNK